MHQMYQGPVSDRVHWLYDLLKDKKRSPNEGHLSLCGIVLSLLYVDSTLLVSKNQTNPATKHVLLVLQRHYWTVTGKVASVAAFSAVHLFIILTFSTLPWHRKENNSPLTLHHHWTEANAEFPHRCLHNTLLSANRYCSSARHASKTLTTLPSRRLFYWLNSSTVS